MLSPRFAALNRVYGEHALHALHISLNIEDKIAALIWKQKLLKYPEKSSLADKHMHSICNAYTKSISIRCSVRILLWLFARQWWAVNSQDSFFWWWAFSHCMLYICTGKDICAGSVCWDESFIQNGSRIYKSLLSMWLKWRCET